MKLTKIQQQEISRIHDAYWMSYLQGDISTMANLLDENYTQVGSAEGEVFSNKKDAVQFLNDTIDQVAGKLEMRNRVTQLEPVADSVLVHEFADIYVLVEGEWMFYSRFRASTLLQKKNDQWKIIHQHSSFPDARAGEGQNIATEKIAAENLQLREAVKRRTIELEQKNRDLEIETSLERVRAVAMGMKQPGDLLDICQIVYQELQALGFAELRNAMINIHDDDKDSFLNYDYSDRAGKTITAILYNSHPSTEKLVKQVKKSRDAFAAIEIKGRELDKWRDYRKGMGEEDDPRLEHIETLTYYFYSIGIGAIGISTYSPIQEEKRIVLKRFRNVFDFAYRRYLDVTQAEAQVYEARIEAALERVRAQSMSMRKSQELAGVGEIIFTELKSLGFMDLRNTEIVINNDSKETILSYYYSDYGVTGLVEVLYKNHPTVRAWIEEMKKADDAFAKIEISENEIAAWRVYREEVGHLPDPKLNDAKSVFYYSYSIGLGALSISTWKPITEEQLKTLERFRNVFGLAYRRYIDVSQAEAQAKEAQIEVALERVRARAMAMHSSNELIEVANVLREQMGMLGQHQIETMAIHLYRDDAELFDSWYAGRDQSGKLVSGTTRFKKDSCWLIRELITGYQSGRQDYTIEASGEKLREWLRVLVVAAPDYESMVVDFPEKSYYHVTDFSGGSMIMVAYQSPADETKDLQKRCAKVFDLAYRRFLDIKHAEAQTRETQIELALERVRARAMAMQKSEELYDIICTLTDQLQFIHFHFDAASFAKIRTDGSFELWISTPDQPYPSQCYVPYIDHKVFHIAHEAVERQMDLISYILTFEEKNAWYKHFFESEQTKTISEERKQYVFNSIGQSSSAVVVRELLLNFIRYDGIPYTEEENNIIRRFGKVFDQSYTRFLDLQKAEAQAREAQIQLALERVRARTMAMQKSDELAETASLLFKQISDLGIRVWTSGFNIWENEDNSFIGYNPTPSGDIAAPYHILSKEDSFFINIYEAKKRGEDFLVFESSGDSLAKTYNYMKTLPVVKEVLKGIEDSGVPLPSFQINHCAFFSYGFLLFITQDAYPEAHDIFKRFAKVFEQTYTRFLDLQKAEAQAREAKIEASLERIRSKTMAMQRSSDLSETSSVLFNEMRNLGMDTIRSGFGIMDEKTETSELWLTTTSNEKVETKVLGILPASAHPACTGFYNAWKNKEADFKYELRGEEVKNYYQAISRHIPMTSREDFSHEEYINCFYFPEGSLNIITLKSFSEEDRLTLLRFARVFGVLYRRFLDIQTAEAQAKEAQIEAALERVRSRSMGMQKTNELFEAAELVGRELSALGVTSMNVSYAFVDDEEKYASYFSPNPVDGKIIPFPFVFPHTETDVMRSILLSWKKQELFNLIELDEEATLKHQTYIGEHIQNLIVRNNSGIPFSVEAFLAVSPKKAFIYTFNFTKGYLFNIGGERLTAMQEEMVMRFTKVFDMTYRRFLDLKQAEAQTREAQIQLAMERVRARTMAMQNSKELPEAANLLFQQVQSLGMPAWSTGYCIWDEDKQAITLSMSSEGVLQPSLRMPLTEDPSLMHFLEAHQRGDTFFVEEVGGEALKNHYVYLRTLPGVKETLDDIEKAGFPVPTFQIFHCAYFSKGFLLFITYDPVPEAHDIFKRFGKVFDQTYTRFLDLQNAEAQSRESQIQLALERVRARTMAMQKSDELPETSYLLFQQVKELGYTAVQNSIGIINEDAGFVELSTTVYGHHLPHTLNVPINDPYVMAKAVAAWKAKHKSLNVEIRGQELKDYNERRNSFFETKVIFPEDQWIVNIVFFSKGWLSFSSDKNISDETYDLLKRFAAVFEQTYIRFSDLKQAEAQAREAEIQLALERVRARSLAMHHTSELQDIVDIVAQQLYHIGMDINGGVLITINDEVDEDLPLWASSGAADYVQKVVVPFFDRPIFTDLRNAIKRRNNFFANEYGKAEKDEMFDHLFRYAPWSSSPEERKKELLSREGGLTRSAAISQYTSIAITNHNGNKFSEEEHEILKRFGNVFEQSYTRFLDLQKAEAQAREAQIEVAVERVRAQSMAMHQTSDLEKVNKELLNQLHWLKVNGLTGVTIWLMDEHEQAKAWDLSSPGNMGNPNSYTVKYDPKKYPILGEPLQFFKNSQDYFTIDYPIEKIKKAIKEWREVNNDIANAIKEAIKKGNLKHQWNAFGRLSNGLLSIDLMTPPSDDTKTIVLKMAGAFNLAYKRFLDLQKAEIQAREAKIEAAVERVRAKALAMHKSEEIINVVNTLRNELGGLNIPGVVAATICLRQDNGSIRLWDITTVVELEDGFHFSMDIIFRLDETDPDDWIRRIWDADEKYFVVEQDEKSIQRTLAWTQKYSPEFAESARRFLEANHIEHVWHPAVPLSHGKLSLDLLQQPVADEEPILTKMGAAFDLAYKRFLDLKNAEAQTREVQIQLSLERVRARAMAMHHSDELTEVLSLLFEQFDVLAINPNHAILSLVDFEKNTVDFRLTGKAGKRVSAHQVVDLDSMNIWKEIVERWKKDGPDVINCIHYPKELLPQVWEIFSEVIHAIPADARIRVEDFPDGMYNTEAYCQFGYIGFCHTRFGTEEEKSILLRFATEFGRLYQRFLDLQKAEAQAREAQIETSLERVRSRAMAMQKSTELGEASALILRQFNDLGYTPDRMSIGILNELSQELELWATGREAQQEQKFFKVPWTEKQVLAKVHNAWKQNEKSLVIELKGDPLREYIDFWRSLGFYDEEDDKLTGLVIHCAFFSKGYIGFITSSRLPLEVVELLERFAGVFGLTYLRFFDLQKAEAQAREAKIEVALERARTQSMLMQHSNELDNTLRVFHEQVLLLGIQSAFSFLWLPDEEKDRHIFWAAWAENVPMDPLANKVSSVFRSKAINYPLDRNEPATTQCLVDWKGKEPVVSYQVPPSGVEGYFAAWQELIAGVEHLKPEYFSSGLYYVEAFMKYGCFGVMIKSELPEEEKKILGRFAIEFERAYTRFLDLQKAEAQAREARIETSLEKVRSRTMAMQQSHELGNVATVLFKELNQLVENLWTCGFVLCERDRGEDEWWLSTGDRFIPAFYLPNTGDATHANIYDGWKKGETYHTEQLEGEALQEHYDWLMNIPVSKNIFDEMKAAGNSLPTWQKLHCAYFSYGYLVMITQVPCAEEQIFKRFAQVFDQTYTRFLDLQKAEAQAREARIEAALEKVRSRTMGMQRSEELSITASEMFKQIQALGLLPWACGFNIFDKDEKAVTQWMSLADGGISPPFRTPLTEDPFFISIYEARQRREDLLVMESSGKELEETYRYMFNLPDSGKIFGDIEASGFEMPKFQITHCAYFSQGYLVFITYEQASESWDIFKRFAKVFEQTYTRFLDLQKAEAQASEAIKRASVDRVRAEIASMRTTNDLDRIIPLIWSELTTLGVPFIRCGVFIMDESQKQIQTLLSTPEGKSIATFQMPFDDTEPLPLLLPHWQRNEMYKTHWDETAFIESTKILMRRGAITSQEQYTSGFRPTNLHLHFLPFLQGMLYVGSEVPLTDEEIELAQNLADAFSTAYARYEDFNKLETANNKIEKTLVDLKQTQAQLIQSEKMASLGELTAGIAHEIQNPLNFVNNFSSINAELIDEMKQELAKGNEQYNSGNPQSAMQNLESAIQLANNIVDNELKIIHHGKRAESIVKGMLQHSRTSTGTKERTDINALADEYMRLAYHGMRAKDKSFNAELKMDLDPTLPLVNVIPQDIGRVLLNLFNNAFWACAERSLGTVGERANLADLETGIPGVNLPGFTYSPTVTLTTKNRIDHIEIRIHDNGPGIPKNVIDKIFQPFFTTKPTGQGTGLGLSLSYDIVKAHGGELKVETAAALAGKEVEGSAFIIHLPTV